MAKLSTQQEVLIVNGTYFTSRQYVEKNKPAVKDNYLSQNEKLKEACWNGQLKDMLPEIFYHFTPDTQLFLWQMRECENIITLEMSENPIELDYYASIDPYCFMEIQEYN